MKKLIITTILAAILPAYLATAEDNNNPTDGKPKQGQGGKCQGKDGKGKGKKKGKPGQDGQKNNNQ